MSDEYKETQVTASYSITQPSPYYFSPELQLREQLDYPTNSPIMNWALL